MLLQKMRTNRIHKTHKHWFFWEIILYECPLFLHILRTEAYFQGWLYDIQPWKRDNALLPEQRADLLPLQYNKDNLFLWGKGLVCLQPITMGCENYSLVASVFLINEEVDDQVRVKEGRELENWENWKCTIVLWERCKLNWLGKCNRIIGKQ